MEYHCLLYIYLVFSPIWVHVDPHNIYIHTFVSKHFLVNKVCSYNHKILGTSIYMYSKNQAIKTLF